jgi:hypothetical protein
MMKKSPIIAGITIGAGLLAFAGGSFFVSPETQISAGAQAADRIFMNPSIDSASVTYLPAAQAGQSKSFTLSGEENFITPQQRDQVFTRPAPYIVSYMFESKDGRYTEAELDTRQKRISVTGLDPRQPVSVSVNEEELVAAIPADWAGRMALSYDIEAMGQPHNLCLRISKEQAISESLGFCHSFVSMEGQAG